MFNPFHCGRFVAAAVPAAAVIGLALGAAAVDEDLAALIERLQGEKTGFAERQNALLAARYDLGDRPARDTAMSGGKLIQEGVRVKLPAGVTWESLAALSPDLKARKLWPAGFLPLPSRCGASKTRRRTSTMTAC